MLKSVFATVVFAAGLAFAALAVNPAPAAAQELASAEADISALVAQYQDDPDGLETAIEAYVRESEDPVVAAQAVVSVSAGLPAESPLKVALGRGLGAAIAVIALTDPVVATSMQAVVAASDDETLVSAVSAGTSDKTASIEEGTGGEDDPAASEEEDETPEQPASAT